MRRSLPFVTLVLCTTVYASQPAPARVPDFSGTWHNDTAASRALTEKKGLVWRVAGAGAGGTGTPPGAKVMRPETVITQSATEIVIERRYEGEVIDRNVYKLDGSESVNASRSSSTRSKTVWKGSALVTTGTFHMDLSGEATDRNGQPIREINRTFVTTRTLQPDGSMHIENRSTQDGQERISWSVLVRTKAQR